MLIWTQTHHPARWPTEVGQLSRWALGRAHGQESMDGPAEAKKTLTEPAGVWAKKNSKW